MAERGTARSASFPIAINASILGERPSGLGQYTVNLVRALDAIRPGLTVYTSAPESFQGLTAAIHGVPVFTRPERGIAGHVARLAWCQTVLRARIRRSRPGVVLNTVPEGILGGLVPEVTVVHDLIPLAFPQAFPSQQWYFRHFVRAVVQQSRLVLTDSEATRRAVIGAYGLSSARVRTIPCGYDRGRFRCDGPAAPAGATPYVLYVGNVMPHKNLDRLVEACAAAARRARVRCILVGSGKRAPLEALAALIARTDAPVELRRYVEPGELPALYRGARALVLPSLAEGFGLPALEAMACGTPVITSNVSSLPEVVDDAALLVDPEDTAALAEAIVAVVTHDALHGRLRALGLARATRFSWDRTARDVLTAIEEVAQA